LYSAGNAGNLDWPHLFGIIQGIAKGVHHMHKKAVVHLNLKPENILMKGSKNAQPQINKIRKARELKGGANKEITLDAKSLPAKG
jgi:L1 cell adhesion molecule like protein